MSLNSSLNKKSIKHYNQLLKASCIRRILISIVVSFILLPFYGCSSPERTYQKVPERSWKRLTAEQQQLIIDEAYQADIRRSRKNP